MVGIRSIPKWLDALLNEKFFDPCLLHTDPSSGKRAEKNIFCFDCCITLCSKCVSRHRKHAPLVQVRRYVYHDVLKLVDAERIIDCCGVQSYISNGAKVVFIRERPLTRLFKSPGGGCFNCNRNLQDPFLFCSLSCKVKHLVSTQGRLKINVSNNQILGFSDIDEYHLVTETPDSVLDSLPNSSGSTATSDIRADLLSSATTEVVRKKRSNLSFSAAPIRIHNPEEITCTKPAGIHNPEEITCTKPAGIQKPKITYTKPGGSRVKRRKGVPNRSPMC